MYSMDVGAGMPRWDGITGNHVQVRMLYEYGNSWILEPVLGFFKRTSLDILDITVVKEIID
jgi:hypothetical protein